MTSACSNHAHHAALNTHPAGENTLAVGATQKKIEPRQNDGRHRSLGTSSAVGSNKLREYT
eukprot:6195704-Pleurochrysis_carterae.AAC.2